MLEVFVSRQMKRRESLSTDPLEAGRRQWSPPAEATKGVFYVQVYDRCTGFERCDVNRRPCGSDTQARVRARRSVHS